MDAIKMFNRMVKKLELNRVIDQSTGCWLYTGNKRPNGYGYLTYQSRNHSVHRLSAYIWLDMSLSSRQQVNHKPICPNKHCFNPEHLYIGNQSQNLHDYYGPINQRTCPNGHKLSDSNIYVWKDYSGKVYRWCKLCKLASLHKYRSR